MAESASGDVTVRIGRCIDDVAAALTGQRECYFKIISTEGDNNSPDIEIISDPSESPSSDEIDYSMPIFPLRYPVGDPGELDDSRHIDMHLASERRDRTCTEQTDEAFDQAVLRVVEHLYDELGLTTDILDVDERFWQAMHLYHVRGFDSILELIEHLDTTPRSASAIGFANDQSPRKDWYYERDVFDDWGIEERIQEIAKRAVHGVWRAGWYVPDEVEKYWNIDKGSIEKAHPTEETRREAIRNWVRLLINDAADSLDFNRDVNVAYDILEFIALFAHSAGLDAGITNSHRTAGWLADDDHIPSGSRTSELINQFHDYDSGENTFPVEEVNDEFIQLHERVIDRCAEYGILPDSVDVAFDLIEIPWYGFHDLNATIGTRNTDTDSFPKWTLAFLSAVDTDMRLCLGVEYVSSKSQYPDALDRQLEFADRRINIGRFYMDSNGHSGEIIDTVRRYTDNYTIKAEKRGKTQNTIGYWLRHASPGEPLFRTAVDATSATPRPDAAFIPNDSVSSSTTSNTDVSAAGGSTQVELGSVANDDRSATAADTGGSLYTHTPYLVDADVDPESISSDVGGDYSARWAAEVTADELQNHFHPVTQSSRPAQRAYLSNISMLLLNWHTLINNARSPKLGLSLDVTHQELLLAIQDVGFSGIGKTR